MHPGELRGGDVGARCPGQPFDPVPSASLPRHAEPFRLAGRPGRAPEELLTALRDLDGTEPDETPTRKGRQQCVQINRTLQYLAHLGDKARLQILDQYYAAREHDGHVSVRDEAADEPRSPG